jgi:phosphatidylserine/phosphatidylglycerophosphate/cardiolipin synthase-like enzyme
MAVELTVRPGMDSAFLAWKAPFTKDCRGFALKRRIKRAPGSAPSANVAAKHAGGETEEIVASWVGFASGPAVPEGTRKPTTDWPIQKYVWSDFAVNCGDTVSYQVVPMTGSAGALGEAAGQASAWSPAVEIGAKTPGNVSCFFNRGIVASQWLSRLLPKVNPGTTLAKTIADAKSPIRRFLAGAIRDRLTRLLEESAKAKGHIYAALFELDDPELVPLLKAFGKRAHIVLGNGSVKKKGEDENGDARATLKGCDLHDRMSAPRALAHNKFLVVCDAKQQPQAVWTGSTNWTKSGLCTQANNALLVENKEIATFYREHWDALVSAGDASPPELFKSDGKPRTAPAAKGTTVWFTPMHGGMDLEQAGKLIASAKDGILFLMFNPGPRGSLLNDIIELASPAGGNYRPDLYIQGVVNQNPGTNKNPVVLFNRGERIEANADVVLPAAIPGPLKYWREELLKLPHAHAMVHSKVVVIDPFGARPVVMTGSHNLGPKASGVNDENFLIIEGNGELAGQYAANVMEIYSQYRWRQSVQASKGKPKWSGLADDDGWQIRDAKQSYDKRRLRELAFWFGTGATGGAAKRRGRRPKP